ncbi:hypothetical protein AQUCO_01400210v1 [Aquilegia coerulea]|uniref:Sister chromatid cohesion protein PDS5 homolog A n=1 Tax=Aquilegia coerulea TaxID=218851 RepID=A0A2G5DVT4_AQUCA|nr:hypothetical protein AQUCO_01400210v1 [Aquilegia coerulea]
MEIDKEKAAAKVIYEVGEQLSQQTRLNKDTLVKSLRKAEDAFPVLGQSSSLKPEIEPLNNFLIKHKLLQHKDKDVRVLVASCLCQIIRVLAPHPPYSDEILRDIFALIISMFAELSDTKSPYFTRRVKILETFAKLKCCLLMVDIGCDDLVLEMFNIFFSVVREHHQKSVLQSMLSIMAPILDDKVSQPLVDVILCNLLREEKGGASASFRLAVSIIEESTSKLEPFVQRFLTSCILDRDSVESELKDYYHEIIYEIFQCAPPMLVAVIPSLSHELLTDQVDVRIKAVNLLGKLFALPGHHVVQEYRQLFVEFLKRFSDKSAEVRISALQCAKVCYTAIMSGTEAPELLDAIEKRLLDFDDKVRIEAVITICDLARSNLKHIQSQLILHAMGRLRDKKVSVRKSTMQKLLELYRDYCIQCSEGLITLVEHFEQIPCKILMLCYDKDCKDFRPQNMELVLAEDLFPAGLSVEERMRHWIFLFSIFTPAHEKAFSSILSQKWRLQMEMQVYLKLRKEDKGNSSDDVQKKIRISCRKMSASFVDPSKAEECFEKLQQMKDEDIFNKLFLLVNDKTSLSDDTRDLSKKSADIRGALLGRVEKKHPLYEFLRVLSLKCSCNIFGSEHVRLILSDLSEKNLVNKHLEKSSVNLLLNVVSISPSLLRGSEDHLRMLVSEEENPFCEKLLQILMKASRYISIALSDIYPSLERACLEGTRLQSKYAISIIAALGGTSGDLAFSNLYEKLVDSLHAGQNMSTVLQSLGCIAQYSFSLFGSREKEITEIIQTIFHEHHVHSVDDLTSSDEDFGCSTSCRLKIYGLKTLVKSFLPYQGTHVRHQIKELFIILSKILPEGKFSDDSILSENDSAHIRLAAAKSVLRLARRWDLHILPQIFHLVILKARDPSSHVRVSFLDKIHKLLKDHAIPSRYACAFALASSDCLRDVQTNSLKYMEEFIREHSKEARRRQTSGIQNQGETNIYFPGYIMVFLIHVLAHDPCFPPENCHDEEIYARFCSPLVAILQALISASCDDTSRNVVNDTLSYMLNIFRAIRKSEDAVDVKKTSLHILADIGLLLVKGLTNSGMPSYLPGSMLLPSSFYKVIPDIRCDEENLSAMAQCPFDENSIEKVLHFYESNIAGTATSLAKQSRKSQEERLQLNDSKNTAIDFPLHKEAGKLASRVKIEKENSSLQRLESRKTLRQVNTRGKNKQALSPSDSGLVGIIKQKEGVNGTELNLGRNQMSSSCGSIITKPSSSESLVSEKEVGDIVRCGTLREKGRNTTNRKLASEPFECSEASLKNKCSSKGVGDMDETLIGQRIKLWSPIDKCYYSGSIDGFDSQNSSHKVTYDNGEVELLRLTNEKWEIVSSVSSPNEETNKCRSIPSDPEVGSSISNPPEIDIPGNRASKRITAANKRKGHFDTKRAPYTVEKRKVHNLDSKASDVLDVDETAIARRTRNRKA